MSTAFFRIGDDMRDMVRVLLVRWLAEWNERQIDDQ